MLKWKVTRAGHLLRPRKIIIEIYEETLVTNSDGSKVVKEHCLDVSFMFGGLLSTDRALERLERRINNRVYKRMRVAQVLKKSSLI